MKLSNKRKRDVGTLGESICVQFFRMNGHKVQISGDEFDPDKDILINDQTLEVKTQTLYRNFCSYGIVNEPAFTVTLVEPDGTVHSNQSSKCANVDRLIFVRRPSVNDPVIRIYETPPMGKRKYHIGVNKKDGRVVQGYLLRNMTEIGVVTRADLVQELMEEIRWAA